MAKNVMWLFVIVAILIFLIRQASTEIYSRNRSILELLFWISVIGGFASYLWYRSRLKS
jgi:hypothetical protein